MPFLHDRSSSASVEIFNIIVANVSKIDYSKFSAISSFPKKQKSKTTWDIDRNRMLSIEVKARFKGGKV